MVNGPQVALFVPRAEFAASNPTFRFSAFRHEGDFGLSGGLWSADYAPLLGEALYPTTDLVIDVAE